jgi:hypothetical protein
MSNNVAKLQRELNVYIMEGNDYMVEKIQKLIDDAIKKRNSHNLNEVIQDDNSRNLAKIYED